MTWRKFGEGNEIRRLLGTSGVYGGRLNVEGCFVCFPALIYTFIIFDILSTFKMDSDCFK